MLYYNIVIGYRRKDSMSRNKITDKQTLGKCA